jgi:ribose transport system substrate-binding protein
MKKKILAVLMAACMTAGLAACGNSENDAKPQEDSTPDAADSGDTKEDAGASEDSADTTPSAGTGEILSTGPNGEKATDATELTLTDEEKQKIKDGGYTAAISFHYGGNDWSASQLKGLTDTFNDLGIELVATTDANFAAEQQVADLETIMAKSPDVLVSIPTDATATADAYKRVVDGGTKVVFMDNVPSGFKAGTDYVSCVSADNYGNGAIAADLLAESLGNKGKIGIVYYDVDFFVTNQRLEAFKKTVAEKYPDLEIVSEQGFTDENACDIVADAMLTQNPDIEGIFALWDIPCEGVLSSVQAAGRSDIKLTTIDLGNNIAKEIAKGSVVGLGAQLPYDQGVAEATLAAYSILGKEAPAYVAVPAKRVEKSNIAEAYEDVYHVAAPDWLVEAAK